MKQTITVITTGGTIEKVYDEDTGVLSNRSSQLRLMLKRLRLPYTQIEQLPLLCKDSLDMTEEDRNTILVKVRELLPKGDPIVILHGTDTMAVTAQHLYDYIPAPEAAIVLTGAMRPFGFENSDALQNFTETLMAARLLAPGVYISMHNKVHALPGVTKNREKGTFEKLQKGGKS